MDFNRINIYDNGEGQPIEFNYQYDMTERNMKNLNLSSTQAPSQVPVPAMAPNVRNNNINMNNVASGANNGAVFMPRPKVEIRISCSGLPKLDVMSKVDPKVFVFFEEKINENGNYTSKWIKIGGTETLKNEANPRFCKSFIFDYYFEYVQKLRFVFMDMDGENEGLENNDYIGYVEKSLGELLSRAKDKVCICDIMRTVPCDMNLTQKKKRDMGSKSVAMITIEPVRNCNLSAVFNIKGKDLDKKDVIGSSDPYFVISKLQEDGSFFKVYQSEVIMNNLNPTWNNIEIELPVLNSGDEKRNLLWEVYDWDKNSKPDFIGSFEASLELIKKNKFFALINEKKKEKKSGYKRSGVFEFETKIIDTTTYSFMDYIMNGTDINVIFAIDFTASNGEPPEKHSLHYDSPDCDLNVFSTLNHYQKAIAAIGHVLEPYDSNNEFGAYGFGAIFNDRGRVEFDYPLSTNFDKPNVKGIEGVLVDYTKALGYSNLSGPTYFGPMIRKVADMAKLEIDLSSTVKTLKNYYILVIITDGEIDDLEDTIEEIIDASKLPMSIVIAGVGESKFSSMEKLDSDAHILKSKDGDRTAERDIVQFVPIEKYISNPEKLASETLAEIPRQLTDFGRKFRYIPPKLEKK